MVAIDPAFKERPRDMLYSLRLRTTFQRDRVNKRIVVQRKGVLYAHDVTIFKDEINPSLVLEAGAPYCKARHSKPQGKWQREANMHKKETSGPPRFRTARRPAASSLRGGDKEVKCSFLHTSLQQVSSKFNPTSTISMTKKKEPKSHILNAAPMQL